MKGRSWKQTGDDELSVSLYGPLSRMTAEEREELISTTSGQRVVEIFRQMGLLGSSCNANRGFFSQYKVHLP